MDTDDFPDVAALLTNSLGLSFIGYMDAYHFDTFIANFDMAWPFFAAFFLALGVGIHLWISTFRDRLGVTGSICGLLMLTGFWVGIYEYTGIFKLPSDL